MQPATAMTGSRACEQTSAATSPSPPPAARFAIIVFGTHSP
jgi:hypothetical protein